MQEIPAILVLENGSVYRGTAFGHIGDAAGEVVFNTSLTGYQEILTDPSYAGQMVVMTYPLIGNYGITPNDDESKKIWASALIVREASNVYSNFESTRNLSDMLKEAGVMGLAGIDTRKLVREIRRRGAMRGVISTSTDDIDVLKARALGIPEMTGLDLVSTVTTDASYTVDNEEASYHVVAFDYGIKTNILRQLKAEGCRVTVVTAKTTADEVLALNPDGVFLSNGPGDPFAVTYAIDTIRALATRNSKLPIFGICLGHQLLSLAFGAKTYKLKFGHHGANHPVKNMRNNAIEITSQNHGFAVEIKTLPSDLELTHKNLYDQTVEGIHHRELPCFSVQYHPEAAPGPHDSHYLFKEFTDMMNAAKN